MKVHFENVSNTSYYRYLLIALRDLFGLKEKEINDENWAEVSRRIAKKSKDNIKWSLRVLEKMNLKKVILCVSRNGMPHTRIVKDERLVQVVGIDHLITAETQLTNRKPRINSLDDYLNMVDESFEKAVKAGAVGIKSTLAYQRKISYETTAKSTAERIFTKGIRNASLEEKRMFQDFMMHVVCEKCEDYNLPFQIHTGIHARTGVPACVITNSNPVHLTNLFQEYPDVKFDMFHGGYPYIHEAGILAKYYPNVYLDACWLTHISPAAYRRGLDEWLEILPANKIFAWGGDNILIEHSYASLMLAKDLIADVLAAKVNSGYFSLKVAKSVANKILGENAIKIFGF
jgi:predicted TIM-barrel fold metal-dependent hydrolase